MLCQHGRRVVENLHVEVQPFVGLKDILGTKNRRDIVEIAERLLSVGLKDILGTKNRRDVVEIALFYLSVELKDIRGTKNRRNIVETVFVLFILALEGFILHVG